MDGQPAAHDSSVTPDAFDADAYAYETLGCLGRRPRPRASRAARSAAMALYVGMAPVAVFAAPSDGDLNADGRLDAADARIALQIAKGERAPTAEELQHGDVAPLETAPEQPSEVNPGDVALMLRALRGEDVDGDGLAAPAELEEGASPFRADTDRDGLGDPEEIAAGSDPADGDTDGDGVPDADEVAQGTDPSLADTDGDGTSDAADAQPLTGVRYLHADHLGSSVVVTKADGTELERATYLPYGGTVSGAPAPEFGFTGQRFEKAVGIYDYGARWYDPRLGRFLQPDSVVPDPDAPQTLNRYAYVRNNPLNRLDPSGNTSFATSFSGTSSGFDPFAATDRFFEALTFGSPPDSIFGGGFQPFETQAFLDGSFGSFGSRQPSFGSESILGAADLDLPAAFSGDAARRAASIFDRPPLQPAMLPLTPPPPRQFDNGFNTAIGVSFPLVAAGGAAGFRAAQPFVRSAFDFVRIQGQGLAGVAAVSARSVARRSAVSLATQADKIPLLGPFAGGLVRGSADAANIARFPPSLGRAEAFGRTVGAFPFELSKSLQRIGAPVIEVGREIFD